MSVHRYLPAARYVGQAIPGILAERGMRPPFISRYILSLTEQGNAWLFVVMEVSLLERPEDYTAPDVLHYLSVALNGLPVISSDSHGLRYAVLLGSAFNS
jgi:hypothetical protein